MTESFNTCYRVQAPHRVMIQATVLLEENHDLLKEMKNRMM